MDNTAKLSVSPMTLTVTLEFSSALISHIITSIIENFPEASSGATMQCIGWRYARGILTFEDTCENKHYVLECPAFEKAFQLMFTDKWPKGCTPVPTSTIREVWDNWFCDADADDFDAFIQLAAFGEVRYG